MYVEYKRDVNHSYLILQGPEEVDTAGYQTRMILCNHLSSLLLCKIQGMDGRNLFYYEITSRQSLSERYGERKIGQKEIRQFFQSAVRAIQELGSYLLDAKNLVLAPELIYLETDCLEAQFCYLPGYNREIREQFQGLTEYFLPRIDHKDSLAVTLGYGLYRVSMEAEFQIDKIKEELYQEYEKKEERDFQGETDLPQEKVPLWEEEVSGLEKSEGHGGEAGKPLFLREESSAIEKRWRWQAALPLPGAFILGALAWRYWGGNLELSLLLAALAVLLGMVSLVLWIYAWRERRPEKAISSRPVENNKMEQSLGDHSETEVERTQREGKTVRETGQKKRWEQSEIHGGGHKSEVAIDSGETDCGGSELTVILSEVSEKAHNSLVGKEEGKLPPIILDKELLIIGKIKPAADVILPYPTVSRIHAKIRRVNGIYYLTDLNSRNGTFVNGQLLQGGEERPLQDQDEVQFADLAYLFLGAK